MVKFDGSPVANASLTLVRNGRIESVTATNANGTYRFTGILHGNYTLEVSAYGYTPQLSDPEVLPYKETEQNFSLRISGIYPHIDIPYRIYSLGETITFNITATDPWDNVTNITDISISLKKGNQSILIPVIRKGKGFIANYTIPSNSSLGQWVLAINITAKANLTQELKLFQFLSPFFIQLRSSGAYIQDSTAGIQSRISRYSNLSRFLTDEEVNVTLTVLNQSNQTVLSKPLSFNDTLISAELILENFSLGNYTLCLTVMDKQGNVMNASKTFQVINDFSITVNTDRKSYNRSETVRISGNAAFLNGEPLVNASLQLIIIHNKGFRRVVYSKTGSNGSFSYDFTPFSAEAGVYRLAASVYSAGIKKDAEANFTILGLLAPSANVEMSRNSAHDISLPIRNVGNTTLSGIDITLMNSTLQGTSISILNQSNTTILPEKEIMVGLRINSSLNANSTTFSLRISSNEGAVDYGRIHVSLYSAFPVVTMEPSLLEVGMNPGDFFTYQITLSNVGYGTMKGVRVLEANNSWIATSPCILGDIKSRESKNFDLRIHAPQTVGIYQDEIRIISSNHQPLTLYLVITVTSARNGSLSVHVMTEWGEDISGAYFRLQSQDVPTLVESCLTNSSGGCLFLLPTGRYSYLASKEGYESTYGTVRIYAGMKKNLDVTLPARMMSVTLNITPIKIGDKYYITLDLTYDTDIPPPYLLPVPTVLEHYVDRNDVLTSGVQLTKSFTLYNPGMVSIHNVSLKVEVNDSGYSIILPQGTVKKIEAQGSVSIPYTLDIEVGTGVSDLENGLVGNIKMDGKFIHFKPNTDLTLRGNTSAEVHIKTYEAGVRKLLIEPDPVSIITNENYSFFSVEPKGPEENFMPPISIKNVGGGEWVYVLSKGVGGAVKYDPVSAVAKILAVIGSGGLVGLISRCFA